MVNIIMFIKKTKNERNRFGQYKTRELLIAQEIETQIKNAF